MSPNAKLWIAAVAAGLIGVLVGGGVVWAVQQKPSDSTGAATTEQLVAAKKLADEKDALIASLTEKYNAAVASTSVTPNGTVISPPASGGAVRQFAFVDNVTTIGGKTNVISDYAQFLTGKAAATAATAHGDESPPPNDYYIVNDNTKLRTLVVKPGISVKLTARDDGTSEPNGYKVTLAKWASYFAAPADNTQSITKGPYWLTVTDGVVTAIEEQYTP